MNSIDETYGATGATVIRVGLGSVWIAHALMKWFVFTIPGFASWLDAQGLPGYMAYPVFILELTGGVMILIGFYGRYVSAVLAPIMLVVMWTHIANGWSHTSAGGGWEYPLFLVLTSIAHTLLGDGNLAVRSNKNLLHTEK